MNYVIETNNISKFHGDVRALYNVNLRAKRGEVYGFLGLNGVGKTTAIRAFLGMICPSEGNVNVLDQVIDQGGSGPWALVGHLVVFPGWLIELLQSAFLSALVAQRRPVK